MVTIFKTTAREGKGERFTLTGISLVELCSDRLDPGGEKKQILRIISTFWNWTWNQLITYGSTVGIPGVHHSPPEVTKADFFPLLCQWQEVQARSLWHQPMAWVSSLSTWTKLRVWVTLLRLEPQSHRSLLWAQKQPRWAEIFGVGQRQTVSPVRQTLNHFPLGKNSIFIKILTYIPFLRPNQKTTKTK